MYDKTIYELSQGGFNRQPSAPRYFGPSKLTDAAVRFSESVISMDQDAECGGGWVRLKRLPDSIYLDGLELLAWTKTSNERPTIDGALTPETVD